MEVLFLSHCTPNPPDKGEKIRAFHAIAHLAARRHVHLVCFARNQDDIAAARELADRCASVHVEPLRSRGSLAGAILQFAAGRSLTTSFYRKRRLREHVEAIAQRRPVGAVVAYSSAMVPYAPAGVPLLLDMVDVDSQKWFEYARLRRPGFPYRWEGSRLSRLEAQFTRRARCTFVSTHQEAAALRALAPGAAVQVLENGVDFSYFDPLHSPRLPQLHGRRFLVFTGAMDYYPNADAARWFATRIFPELRRGDPGLEFLIVGRHPAHSVRKLASIPGVVVTGTVPDVRPYLVQAQSVVAPLRIARGVQNKVLEALAMRKRVFASTAVCRTFAPELPEGIVPCHSERDFVSAIGACGWPEPCRESKIRDAAQVRFSWATNMRLLADELEQVAGLDLTGAESQAAAD
ncbi:MAG TPA: TIGR03087 family PEP-CTERM/XrtA system glycosyltransferase [Bryobacterales bacterium]|jgi:sugar transferase (PEP-CTERM/EpsH1 system associated)|nr:TIGR03087 family PEP-CTERM/XrtA system glycosyltransferase [Bryobacterales bacterium]